MSQRSLRLLLFLSILFPLFCSIAVISASLYSSSLILLPHLFCYWFLPSIVLFISVTVLFIFFFLKPSSSLLNICNFLICTTILFLRSWVIFSIISLNSFSSRLPIFMSLICSFVVVSYYFVWKLFLCFLILSNFLLLWSLFHKLQNCSPSHLWCLPPDGWDWFMDLCGFLVGGTGACTLVGGAGSCPSGEQLHVKGFRGSCGLSAAFLLMGCQYSHYVGGFGLRCLSTGAWSLLGGPGHSAKMETSRIVHTNEYFLGPLLLRFLAQQWAAADSHLPSRPSKTYIGSFGPGSYGIIAFLCIPVHMKPCLHPPCVKSLFSPLLWHSCTHVLLAFKGKFSGGSSSSCQTPKAGEPDGGLRTLTPVRRALWYSYFLVCGSPTWQLWYLIILQKNRSSYCLIVDSSFSLGVEYIFGKF